LRFKDFGFDSNLKLKYKNNLDVKFYNTGGVVELSLIDHDLKLAGVDELSYLVGRSINKDNSEYTLQQIHFHWGNGYNDSKEGSEHTINGKSYPLEMHLVHFNSAKYANIGEAVDQTDGLLVVGVMFKSGSKNKALKPLTDYMADTDNFFTSEETTLQLDLKDLMKKLDTDKFYSYAGSLTTPPCYESVTWVVLNEIASVSEEQLEAFRGTLKEEGGETLAPNYRPVQSLNKRTLFNMREKRERMKVYAHEDESLTDSLPTIYKTILCKEIGHYC